MKNTTLKKLLSAFSLSLLGISLSSYSYAQCEISSGSAPTINTTIESIWSSATANAITLPLTGTSTPSGFSAQWKCLYTSTNLYYLFEVTKSGTLYNQNGATWWDDDGVEIYLDGDNSGGTSYDGVNDFQFGFRYNDGAIVKTGPSNPANSTTGITYSFYTTTEGYNVEISIPWSTLNVTPVSGNSFGVEAAVNVSGGTRITQMSTYNDNGQSFNNPSLFGTVNLSSCTVAGVLNGTLLQTSVMTTPNPFSNQTLLSFPSVDSYLLSIVNVNGKTVKEYSIVNDDKVFITGDGMENGIYYYIAKNSSQKKYSGKIVVNHE